MQKIVYCFVAILLLSSCKGTVAELAAFQPVDLYEKIDRVIELDEPEQILDIPLAVIDFRIIDSLCFFATMDGASGFISIHRNPTLEPIGRFIKGGRGPNEIGWHMYMSRFTFKEENDSLIAYLPKDNVRLVRWNVSNSICDGVCNFKPMPFTMSHLNANAILLDDGQCFYKDINHTGTGYERYFKTIDGRTEIPFLEPLAKNVSVNDGNMHNIYSTLVAYNRDMNRIAEAGAVQNIINLYDLDGGFAKSVQIGGESVFAEKEYTSWTVTYRSLRGYDSYIACLYSGSTELAIFNKTHNRPVIRLVSWDGKPICEIKLRHHASAFDIDAENGLLYTLDADKEELYCYDISQYGNFLNL